MALIKKHIVPILTNVSRNRFLLIIIAGSLACVTGGLVYVVAMLELAHTGSGLYQGGSIPPHGMVWAYEIAHNPLAFMLSQAGLIVMVIGVVVVAVGITGYFLIKSKS